MTRQYNRMTVDILIIISIVLGVLGVITYMMKSSNNDVVAGCPLIPAFSRRGNESIWILNALDLINQGNLENATIASFEHGDVTDELVFQTIARNKKFQEISIAGTNCSGKVLDAIVECKNVKDLTLKVDGLTDSDVSKLSQLSNLEKLLITVPGGKTFYSLGLCKRLNHLAILSDSFNSESIEWLASLNQIKTLYLELKASPDKQERQIFKQISHGSFANLTRINFRGYGITDQILQAFQGASGIEIAQLSNTSCTDEGLRALSSCMKLQYVYVGGGKNIVGSGLKHLVSCPIRKLYIYELGSAKLDFESLQRYEHLEALVFVQKSPMTEHVELIKFLKDLPKLRYLYVADMLTTKADKEILLGMKNLKILESDLNPEERLKFQKILPDCKIYVRGQDLCRFEKFNPSNYLN